MVAMPPPITEVGCLIAFATITVTPTVARLPSAVHRYSSYEVVRVLHVRQRFIGSSTESGLSDHADPLMLPHRAGLLT